VKNNPIDDLCLAISLGVEISVFCELGVQKRLENQPKGVEEPAVSIKDDSLWYPKVDPHSFEEDIGSIFRCHVLLIGSEDGHL
jgi:hypothetical protein